MTTYTVAPPEYIVAPALLTAVSLDEQRAMRCSCADCGAPGAVVQVSRGSRWIPVCKPCWEWQKGERP